jgi:phage host-nuclease inhibitor protein Gam
MRSIVTLKDVENAMNELQQLEAQAAAAAANANSKIAEIRDEYTPSVAPLEEKAKRLRNAIESWAEDNRDDEELFPKGRKSIELNAGTISIRAGAPSLVLRKGKSTDDVIELLKEHGIKAGIKVADPSLDKTAIKKLYDQGKLDDNDLKKLGLEITQTESVNIELKTVEAYA